MRFAGDLHTLSVSVADNFIGSIEKEITFVTPVFLILNSNRKVILRVKGPIVTSGEADFNVSIT